MRCACTRIPASEWTRDRTAAQWLSEALGEALRLVRVPPDPERMANPAFAGAAPAPMGFADGFPLLVCNEASLEDLNSRMPEPIPMERFRPNIVLEGLRQWAEDRIETLMIGELTLRLVKPCTRCTIPSVDQRTGMPATDPGPVLRKFRFDKALRGVTFGENAVIASGARMRDRARIRLPRDAGRREPFAPAPCGPPMLCRGANCAQRTTPPAPVPPHCIRVLRGEV